MKKNLLALLTASYLAVAPSHATDIDVRSVFDKINRSQEYEHMRPINHKKKSIKKKSIKKKSFDPKKAKLFSHDRDDYSIVLTLSDGTNKRSIRDSLTNLEFRLYKLGFKKEQERDSILRDVFSQYASEIASQEIFPYSSINISKSNLASLIQTHSEFSETILSMAAIESGCNSNFGSYNHYHGILQQSKGTYRWVKGYFSDPKHDKNIKAALDTITAQQVHDGDIKAQIIVADAYLHMSLDFIEKYGKGRVKDKMTFAVASYNLGANALIDFLKKYQGDISWDKNKDDFVSLDRIRRFIPFRQLKNRFRKKAITIRYGEYQRTLDPLTKTLLSTTYAKKE